MEASFAGFGFKKISCIVYWVLEFQNQFGRIDSQKRLKYDEGVVARVWF